MKKTILLALSLFMSGTVFAATDHYVLRDGNHVYHLKVTKLSDEISARVDVDFEAASDGKHQACSADISGEAKATGDNELTLKKQIEGENRYCSIKIKLTPNGATLEQSESCDYFAADSCQFFTSGKELLKIK